LGTSVATRHHASSINAATMAMYATHGMSFLRVDGAGASSSDSGGE
jgi:hypothetical protein